MNFRHSLLKILYRLPYFKGRDRMISMLAGSFIEQPVVLPDGLAMYLDASEWVQLDILVKGATEPLTLALMAQLLKPGDTFVDVGGHVGHHALVAANCVGVSGKVIAIDPQPYNADRIARNANANSMSQILIVCAAAGNTSGSFRIRLQSNRDRSRLSLCEPGPCDLATEIEVPLRRLDEILAKSGTSNLKLAKADVEGFELEVFQGMGAYLHSCENIIFELLDNEDISRASETLRLLESSGFELKTVLGQHWKQGEKLPENNVWACRSPAIPASRGVA